MKYDITKPTAPVMPNLGRGTECVKLLLSQASKGMKKTISRCFSSTWRKNKRSKISVSRPLLEGIVWQMDHLVAESGVNKGQLSLLVEAIIRLFRVDDETEYEKLVA